MAGAHVRTLHSNDVINLQLVGCLADISPNLGFQSKPCEFSGGRKNKIQKNHKASTWAASNEMHSLLSHWKKRVQNEKLKLQIVYVIERK